MTTLIEQAQAEAVRFNEAMAKEFPSCMSKASVMTNIGGSVLIEFANVSSKEQAPNGILMNCNRHMKFMIHLSTDFGKALPVDSPVEVELLNWHFECKKAGLKFRKIKAKSITEALPKLVDWFQKNADKIA